VLEHALRECPAACRDPNGPTKRGSRVVEVLTAPVAEDRRRADL
jgi:hypothetical protein